MTQIIPDETLDKELSEWYDSYHPEYSIPPREKTYYCVFEKWSANNIPTAQHHFHCL